MQYFTKAVNMIHSKHVKHLWKYTVLVLAVALLASALILSVSAEDTVHTGKVGSVTWTMNVTTGELSLTGSGGIFSAPWASYKASIKKVTVADTVTSIPTNAFSDCANLTEVDLGNGINYLWDNSFRNCTALTEITLPDSLSYVYYSVFTGCTALERVHISSVKEWLEINFVDENSNPCFTGGELYVNGERVTELVIPEGTVVINGNAFSGMTQLESVFVSEGVISIGNYAFHNCGELTRVTLPASLCTLGQKVFVGTAPALILFEGTDEQWQNVSVGEGNEAFQSAVISHAGHTYDREITDSLYWLHDADCDRAQTYLKSCVCGEAGTDTFTVGDPLGHTGGEATCSERAVCDVCHNAYGDTLPHTPGTPATCTESQTCSVCHTVLTPKKGHSYKTVVTPATCTAKGYSTHTCTVCSHSYEDTYTAAVSHTPGTPATCTEAQTCSVCHTVLTPKKGHSYKSAVTPATCTEKGYTTHTCTVCSHSYVDAFTAVASHTPGAEATCNEAQTCTKCHTVLNPAKAHSYKTTVTPATCTAKGYNTHTCSTCGHSYMDAYTEVAAHIPGSEATCTEARTCTVCHTVLTPKTGHSYRKTVTPATCTARGYTTHTCTACDHSYVDSYTAVADHIPGPEATCTEAQSCTVCRTVLTEKTAHTYTQSVTPATCTDEGYTTHTCTRCGFAYADSVLQPTGHRAGAAATCDLPQTCTECHSILQNALGHSYEDEVTPPTCTAEGYTTHTCTRCDVAYHDAITSPAGHTAGPEATCSAMQSCTACGAMLADRLEHTFEDSVIQPTCTEAGYTARTCTHCGMTRVEEPTPATGHTAGEWVIDKEPAVGEEGQRHRPCSVCGTVVTLEKIPALEADTDPGEEGTQGGNDPSDETESDPSDESASDPSDGTDETPDGEHPEESASESDTLSADDLLGNLSGCKKAQTITVYILIGVVMLITAAIFWAVDSRRRNGFL